MSEYPRPVTSIHVIELTSACNLKCKYCPHGTMKRDNKLDMTDKIFEQTLAWIKRFVDAKTQGEVALTGVGEPTLYKALPTAIKRIREVIGNLPIVLSTNAVALTEQLCADIAGYGVKVYVSAHRPEKAAPAVPLLKKYNLFGALNSAFVDRSFNWAGQVEWHVSAPKFECMYLNSGYAMVLSDGTIASCCLDAEGIGKVGHVSQNPEITELMMQPFSLCENCHFDVPKWPTKQPVKFKAESKKDIRAG